MANHLTRSKAITKRRYYIDVETEHDILIIISLLLIIVMIFSKTTKNTILGIMILLLVIISFLHTIRIYINFLMNKK